MEFGGNTFCLDNNSINTSRHQNNNSNGNYSWKTVTNNNNNSNSWRVVNALDVAGSAANMVVQQNGTFMSSHPYGGSHVHPDPHLMCLKLGKRHYFEDATAGSSVVAAAAAAAGGGGADKRGKGYSGAGGGAAGFTAAGATVPRCQVEGCHVALLNAKDYHRRHKVCEMHSKAPKVVVLGMEQRFCQQCSRFHVVSEFDDSKRSCRRRLAGHNERRRKSTQDSVARNSSQGGCALSLLSSSSDSWFSPYDLSTRCSAALRELIAENRAAIMARKFDRDRDWHIHNQAVEDFNKKEIQPESNYFPQQMFPQRQ